LKTLALCHTVITEVLDDKSIKYNASSPDELALVNFAKFCNIEFVDTDVDKNMKINVLGK